MSTTIDQRVVEMRFDNQHFERNVQTSMSTLDKLKQSLNLTGATKGFENINTAANKVNFSGLNAGVEAVGVKFSHLQATVQHQLDRIVDNVVNSGKRMASALTIDPIKTGFSEYETQINAVQTILANTSSKGTTLQDVNNALDTLNTYADKTIYNFTEMTRNIGTFTAAGVDLDKSVSAIQGIANLAAVSGSSSQQASNAMYQLSQALAAGRVSLMDWNSVVNAGMGGQVFQDALKRTAKNMGIVVDESKSFRESIQGKDTWLSSDVLIKTLEQFTMAAEEGSKEWEAFKKSLMDEGYTEAQATEILKMANTATDAATKVKTFTQLWDTLKESVQSGWTQSWETIVGDFGEAKKLLTEISDTIGSMIGKSAEARNKLLTEGLSTGWKQLLGQGIADEEGYKDSIKSVAKEHGIAFDEMIKKGEEADKTFEEVLSESITSGKITPDILSESVTHLADSMRNMTEEERKAAGYTDEHLKSIEDLEAGLKNGTISMEEFVKKMERPSGRENIIQAMWNSFNALMAIVKPIKEAFRDIFPAMTGEKLYSLTESLKNFTEKLTISGDTAGKIKRTFKGVFAVLDIGVKAVSALFKGFGKLVGFIAPAGNGLLDFTAGLGDFLVSVNDAIEKSDFFNKAIEKIGKFLSPIGEGIKEFAKSIRESFTEISINAKDRLEPLAVLGEFIKGIFTGLAGLIGKLAPTFAKLASGIGDALGTLSDGLADSIQSADYNKFFDIFNSGVFAAIGVFIAKFVKSASDILGDVGSFKDSIKDILDGTSDALNAFTGSLKADTLKKISVAIGILAASLLVLSLIDSTKLAGSLGAITVLFAELCGALTLFSKLATGKGIAKLPMITAALIGLSTSLVILSAALKILSTMSWSEMGVGLVSISVGLGVLVGALWLLPDGKFDKASKAIRKLSTSLVIFAAAMKILGSLSWDELAVGLTGTAVGLGILVAATWLLPNNLGGKATGILILSSALIVLGGALKIMATMSWDEIGRSLVTLAGALLILASTMALMKKAIPGAAAVTIIAPALVVLGYAVRSISDLTWDEIARGLTTLAGSLLIISGAMALMRKALPGAAALVVVTGALALLTPVLKNLGSMSWGEIGRGLIVLAGAFGVIGIAGLLLKPLIPTILALSAAIALLGISCAAIGAGVVMIGAGITAISAALATGGVAIVTFTSSLIGLIPYLIEQIGVGIIKLCEVISGSASSLCEAFTVIVLALVDAIVTSVPAIAEGIFVLIDELLGTLVEYTPKIVSSLFDFLINVIDVLAQKMPDLVKAGVNLLMSFFSGVIDALKTVDPNVLVNGILAVGLMTALVSALAGIAILTPAAMIGVLGFGTVITELSLVLAAIGALAQIPGLEWLINEGGNFLQSVGGAIGKFIGSLIGGFGVGVTSGLPQMATNLSTFMENLKPFIDGAKSFDASILEGVKSLVGVVLALTAANVIEGLTSWITGGSSLTTFGDEIAAFGPKLKTYADSVSGIDASAIEASANAAKILSELANNLPNSGGVIGFFAGKNDIGTLGEQLIPFGQGMKAYSDAIVGFNSEAVIASANAAKALAEMTSYIPNQGGIVAWFTGDNSVATFAGDLVTLGVGLKDYSIAITGFNAEAVIASANAAKALAEMTSYIPNQGGITAWFTGDNSISKFGTDLIALGEGLKGFSIAIIGINTESIIAAANAAKILAQMTSYIPNEGGIKAWFTGENSISKFSNDLISLGLGLKGFSVAILGVNAESMIAAANAAKILAQMTSYIPNEGGIKAWFTGESSVSKFSGGLILLGQGLKGFADSTIGINAESMITASNAAKSLAQMTSYIPNEGGVKAWFTGESSIANFALQLPMLGAGLLGFSMSVAGINTESIVAASNAAKSLAQMTTTIPNEGGVKAWFTGESSIANFASQLPKLGEGLKGFSDSIQGINTENITAASNAAKGLAQMTNTIPTEGGIKAWFTGETSISNFASQLPKLGEGLKGFSDSVAGINTENITVAANAAKSLAKMADTAPADSTNIITFGTNLVTFGGKLKSYFDNTSGITGESITASTNAINAIKNVGNGLNSANLTSLADAINQLINSFKNMNGINGSTAAGFTAALNKIGQTSIQSLLNKFKDAGPKLKKSGQDLITNFVNGANSQGDKMSKAGQTLVKKFSDGINKGSKTAKKACKDVLTVCATALSGSSNKFSSAGKAVVDGFASGITANTFKAEAKARAMALAALKAAKEALDINSPSKVFREIGKSVPEGFAQGIDRMLGVVKESSIGMTDVALDGVKNSISAISELINTDMDTQPTIRPVLDLSDISSGANAIGRMFNTNPSVDVIANVGAISSMMNGNQNGVTNADVVSAINKLRGDLGSVRGDTYQINGITYDDGSNISEAVGVLVRAAKMERRI